MKWFVNEYLSFLMLEREEYWFSLFVLNAFVVLGCLSFVGLGYNQINISNKMFILSENTSKMKNKDLKLTRFNEELMILNHDIAVLENEVQDLKKKYEELKKD